MAEKEQLLKEKLEHSGLFEFSAMYNYAHNWFKEIGFGVIEEKYAEKVKGDARDIGIEWKASRDMSDYFKFEYKIKFEIEGMKEVEVEIDGRRKKTNTGKVTIEITGVLVMDRDGKWESSPWNRMMRDIYNKYIVPARVDGMRGELIGKAQGFKDDMKTFLALSARR